MHPDTNPARRPYDSLRRAAQARETRADIAHAARRLFLAQGWAATTVREVAREAGVSVPTVYATYGNKAGLTRALADAADLSADAAPLLAELTAPGATPARQLAAMAGYDRRLFERAGDVIALLREAGRTEPELAAAYREGREEATGPGYGSSRPGPRRSCGPDWTSRPPSTSTRRSATSTSTAPSPPNAAGAPGGWRSGGPVPSAGNCCRPGRCRPGRRRPVRSRARPYGSIRLGAGAVAPGAVQVSSPGLGWPEGRQVYRTSGSRSSLRRPSVSSAAWKPWRS